MFDWGQRENDKVQDFSRNYTKNGDYEVGFFDANLVSGALLYASTFFIIVVLCVYESKFEII